MKKNYKKVVIISLLLLLTLTGCTKNLKNDKNEIVKNEITGQSLTENILCQPLHEETRKLYEENNVDLKKLPKCENFKITSGGYEGLWTSIFVKPLAFIIIYIGKNLNNYAIGLILTSILIRLIAYPITRKTAMQSELMKDAQSDINKVEEKYKDKKDQESMMKKSQEMMEVYKKNKINPLAGCLFSFLQLPLFIAFLEAINRVPAIFESDFLGIQLGTNPLTGISNGSYILYILLIILVGISTYFSFKLNQTATTSPQQSQMKMTMNVFLVMIVVMSIFMSSALCIYWITTNLFTILQNLIVKRRKKI